MSFIEKLLTGGGRTLKGMLQSTGSQRRPSRTRRKSSTRDKRIKKPRTKKSVKRTIKKTALQKMQDVQKQRQKSNKYYATPLFQQSPNPSTIPARFAKFPPNWKHDWSVDALLNVSDKEIKEHDTWVKQNNLKNSSPSLSPLINSQNESELRDIMTNAMTPGVFAEGLKSLKEIVKKKRKRTKKKKRTKKRTKKKKRIKKKKGKKKRTTKRNKVGGGP
jgi:hypothetical protein